MPDAEGSSTEVRQNASRSRYEITIDDVRARGGTVVAQCWYVAEFIDQHPEYADLLAEA